jgi:cyclohexa-1,5-dienecarbonyl-CoA hydratase
MPLVCRQTGRLLSVIWERPPLNVLDISLLRDIDAVLSDCTGRGDIDIILLRGAGERAFSAGVDIRDHTIEKVPEMLQVVHGVIRKLIAIPQVSIAAVQGACLGGGLEMASTCDLIVAAHESTFATPEIIVGCYPPVALGRFAALIGYHRAAEMILTGRRFSAGEALAMGLVNRVFPAGEFEQGLTSVSEELLGKSGAVLRLAVRGLREVSFRDFDSALRRSEEIYCGELLKTADVAEGVSAFLEKRPAVWRHR